MKVIRPPCVLVFRSCFADQRFSYSTKKSSPFYQARFFHGGKPSANSATSKASSVDEEELGFFRKNSDQWWRNGGDFRALQAMNELRVPFISDAYIAYGLLGSPEDQRARQNSPFPLQGVKVLDVGCGGGLLSEPLARLGGKVTGIDMVEESIKVAKLHWKKSRQDQSSNQSTVYSINQLDNQSSNQSTADIDYIHGTVEELATTRPGEFDIVVCSEVIEHVNNVQSFVESVGDLTRQGGVTVFTTINRTLSSFAAGIVGAEYLLQIVPRGTHHHSKFVTPDELSSFLRKKGFDVRLQHGMRYNPITYRWSWTSFDGVNYGLVAVKDKDVAEKSA